MHMTIGSYISITLAGMALCLIYVYLYIKEKNRYIYFWSLGWGLYAGKYILRIMSIAHTNHYFYSIGEDTLFAWASYFLVCGTYAFLGKKTPKIWVVVCVIMNGYAIIGTVMQVENFSMIAIAVGSTYIWIGYVFFKYTDIEGVGRYLTGTIFALWGINIMIFLFLRNEEFLSAFRYFLATLLFLIGVCGILITYLEKAQYELKKSEENYRELITLIPDSIIVYSGGKVIFANDAAIKFVGAKCKQEIMQKPMMYYAHPDDYQNMLSITKRVENEESGEELFEYRACKTNGEIVDVEAVVTAIKYEQKKAILYIGRDITERRKAEELREKMKEKNQQIKEQKEINKLKTEIFSNVSHELRTPLNIILSTIQLFDVYMKQDQIHMDKKKMNKRINTMRQNCFRLLRLINNLIDITRCEAKFLKMRTQNHDIVKIVADIVLSISDFVESRGVVFSFQTKVKQKVVACDADKIERIMLNLLSNAIKFTESPGKISVSIYEKDNQILISVKDTGVGIPADKLKDIFKRFKKDNSLIAKNNEGSGIGLSLVKNLVKLHEGRIDVQSEEGKGSEFTVALPIKTICGHNKIEVEPLDIKERKRIEKINIEFSDIYAIER